MKIEAVDTPFWETTAFYVKHIGAFLVACIPYVVGAVLLYLLIVFVFISGLGDG